MLIKDFLISLEEEDKVNKRKRYLLYKCSLQAKEENEIYYNHNLDINNWNWLQKPISRKKSS